MNFLSTFFRKLMKSLPHAAQRHQPVTQAPSPKPVQTDTMTDDATAQPVSGNVQISGTLYCAGSCYFPHGSSGSSRTYCHLNVTYFRSLMQQSGVPEAAIETFLNSHVLDDDTYLHPGEGEYSSSFEIRRLYGRGKCYFRATGPAEYKGAAIMAFEKAIQINCEDLSSDDNLYLSSAYPR